MSSKYLKRKRRKELDPLVKEGEKEIKEYIRD
jgi:hypothetical protein